MHAHTHLNEVFKSSNSEIAIFGVKKLAKISRENVSEKRCGPQSILGVTLRIDDIGQGVLVPLVLSWGSRVQGHKYENPPKWHENCQPAMEKASITSVLWGICDKGNSLETQSLVSQTHVCIQSDHSQHIFLGELNEITRYVWFTQGHLEKCSADLHYCSEPSKWMVWWNWGNTSNFLDIDACQQGRKLSASAAMIPHLQSFDQSFQVYLLVKAIALKNCLNNQKYEKTCQERGKYSRWRHVRIGILVVAHWVAVLERWGHLSCLIGV